MVRLIVYTCIINKYKYYAYIIYERAAEYYEAAARQGKADAQFNPFGTNSFMRVDCHCCAE